MFGIILKMDRSKCKEPIAPLTSMFKKITGAITKQTPNKDSIKPGIKWEPGIQI